MRALFRNAEVRIYFAVLTIISAVISLAAFYTDAVAGAFTAAACGVLLIISLFYNKKRYERLAQLSTQIDRILHSMDVVDAGGFDEGELSILQSEIQKMTVRLREQAENLKKEKVYLSESLADVAHQIRTPLTSINILTSFLSKEDLPSEKRLKLVRELEALLSRIDWLITALLKISKIEAGTVSFAPEKITAETLINKSLEPFSVPLDLHGIRLEKAVSGDVVCDPEWTAEALGNIIKNCMEHAGDLVRIEAEQNSIFTQIVISDNGEGFAGKDIKRLFERFYKGEDEDGEGYGIGLALCKMIITEQNGTVKAESNTQQGAKFTVKLYHHRTL
jgi:signal transduction histidine kinase